MENIQIEGKVDLLRAVMKMSVAMNDLDDIEYNKKYFKYDFKVKARMWSTTFQVFTGNLMKSLVDIDSNLLENVYKCFEDSGITIESKKENMRSLIMFYIKIVSALNDLEEIEDRNLIFPAPILYKFTSELVESMEKQYSFIKNMKDNNGKGIEYLIQYYDEAGAKILHYGEIVE